MLVPSAHPRHALVLPAVAPIRLTTLSGHPLILPAGSTFSAIEGTEFGARLHPAMSPYVSLDRGSFETAFEVTESADMCYQAVQDAIARILAAEEAAAVAERKAQLEVMKKNLPASRRQALEGLSEEEQLQALDEAEDFLGAGVHIPRHRRGHQMLG